MFLDRLSLRNLRELVLSVAPSLNKRIRLGLGLWLHREVERGLVEMVGPCGLQGLIVELLFHAPMQIAGGLLDGGSVN